MDRRHFLQSTTGAALLGQVTSAQTGAPASSAAKQEWRNKQGSMHYRQLGRSGLMVSEVVSGGDPITLDNYKQLELALEMGMNYLDMAPAYNKGDTEKAYGELIKASNKRMKVFLATKVSGLQSIRNRMYKEIFDGLPGDKQAAITKRSKEMMEQSLVHKRGYFFDYYPGQRNQAGPAYLSNAMMGDYSNKVEGGKEYREYIMKSVEGSLQRVGTDHFDILHCPHGGCCPEELDLPEIKDTFATLKQQGKVRFLGVSTHTDPAGVLRAAAAKGHYDMVMCAYNVANGGYMEQAIAEAHAKGVGIIAMKVAMSVATHHKALQPVPQWRIDKVNRIVPGNDKAPVKAYIWALQNPHLTAVISNLWDETFVKENLAVAGKKVELQPA